MKYTKMEALRNTEVTVKYEDATEKFTFYEADLIYIAIQRTSSERIDGDLYMFSPTLGCTTVPVTLKTQDWKKS